MLVVMVAWRMEVSSKNFILSTRAVWAFRWLAQKETNNSESIIDFILK
jgi:hypothetical protein